MNVKKPDLYSDEVYCACASHLTKSYNTQVKLTINIAAMFPELLAAPLPLMISSDRRSVTVLISLPMLRTLREKTTLAVTSRGRFGTEDAVSSSSRRRSVPRSLSSSESIMMQALRLEELQRAKEEKRSKPLIASATGYTYTTSLIRGHRQGSSLVPDYTHSVFILRLALRDLWRNQNK